MRVLVTGNEGYIGSVVTAQLIEAGYSVVGLDLGIFRDVAFVPRVGGLTQQLYQDVRTVEKDDLYDIEAIIHLAGLSNDPLGELDPSLTMNINYEASVRLAQLAKAVGVRRFLFSSTCSTYGKSGAAWVDETSPVDPRTAYARSKVRVEEALVELKNDSFEVVSLRNATVFGISPRLRVDLVVQDLVASGFLTGIVEVLSDGTSWRPLVHIEDVARAFRFFLEAPAAAVSGRAFNVGREESCVQIKDLAALVADFLPQTAVRIGRESSADERSYRVSFTQLYGLGWMPRYSLLAGIKQVYQAFQEQSFSEADWRSDRYITLKRYQRLMAEGVLDDQLRLQEKVVS